MPATYKINGAWRRECDCPWNESTCQNGKQRTMQTAGYARCMIPTNVIEGSAVPAIDKDDENATRYEATAAPVTLDEQIAHQQQLLENYQPNPVVTLIAKSILASLLDLKRIRTAERPEVPSYVAFVRAQINEGYKQHQRPMIEHIDALTAYADRMAAERDAATKHAADLEEILHQAEMTALQNTGARLAAESALAKVVPVMAEVCYQPGQQERLKHINYCRWCHYAEGYPHSADCPMSAQLLRDLASDTTEGRE